LAFVPNSGFRKLRTSTVNSGARSVVMVIGRRFSQSTQQPASTFMYNTGRPKADDTCFKFFKMFKI